MPPTAHPILHALTLSQAQADAAFGPADALVTAGAGAGKTWTLTARFLALLARGLPLRGVVAITFTRKAAREMRKRIREQVWDYLARPDLAPVERQRWNAIASQLDAARISTIHSLCQELLRAHPVEARVDPDFQVLEEGRAALFQHEAVEEALFWAASQAKLAGLFAEIGESRVRRALADMLSLGSEARALLAGLPADADALLASWDESLAGRQQARWREIMTDPDWQAARLALASTRPLDDNDRLAQQWMAAREALDLLDDLEDAGALRRAADRLRGLKLNGGRGAAWPGGAETVQEIRAALRALRAPFTGKGNAWLGGGLNEEDARAARALTQLREIALHAIDIYEGRKRDAHALDFDDLEARAVALLEQHPPVLQRWQEEIQALLVDEFQDVNARQARLLALLDGGRGVRFLVGDAKQSIYRFRGAEVAVFNRTEQAFQAGGQRVARLNATYRAHAHLVASLNDLLEPVLGEARHPWEASFVPLQPARATGPLAASDAYIEVQFVQGAKPDALPAAARAAVHRLLTLFDQGYEPGQAAILCRHTRSFAFYEDALDAAGVPFLTLAGRGFFQRPEVRDLTGVLRAADDLTDDAALAGALRSPGLGLSDVALYHLALARQQRAKQARAAGAPRHIPLWEMVQTPPDDFPPDELPRLLRARELLADLHAMAGRIPVADLLKTFLDKTDYLAILAGAGQSRAVRNVNKLLVDVQQTGLVRVSEFLTWIDLAGDVGAREGEAPVVAAGAVQIMTVHRAKGLEFPIVVLGDIASGGRSNRDLVISEGVIAWKLPARPGAKLSPALHLALSREMARKEEAEDKRLFYVAATRAEDYLILNGHVAKRNSYSGWMMWLRRVLPELETLLKKGKEAPAEVIEQYCPLGNGGRAARCTLFPSDALPPRVYTAPTPSAAPAPCQLQMLTSYEAKEDALDETAKERETEPERRVWRILPEEGARAWAPAWMVGKLVHRAIELERMPDAPGFEAWLEASARSLGLSDARMLKDAVRRAQRLLDRLAASPLWTEIQAAEQRMHEAPYAYLDPDGDASVRGTIDLVYRLGERWTLVDFKTDRAKDRAHMEAIIQEKGYDSQVARYVQAMETLLDVTPRAFICFLDVAGRVTVWAWQGNGDS